jgi:hypothetical protein
MIIQLSPDTTPHLDDADNFRAFKIVAPQSMDRAALTRALGTLGRLHDDSAHAWIDEAALRQLANRPDDKTWHDSATAMIGYARKSGWIDAETGAIRAHIERA